MEHFLRKRELVSFSVSSSSFPQKEKFLTRVVELDHATTKIWTVLPDGTKVHLECISGFTFSCLCKNGLLHGEFESPYYLEKRTGSFNKGKAHGNFFCWRYERLALAATFIKGKVFEMESSFHDGLSQSFLFSRNKKDGSLHVLHKRYVDGRFVVRKILMTKVSEKQSVFSCPFVPFEREPVYKFEKQTIRKTEHFANKPNKEKICKNKVNMFFVD